MLFAPEDRRHATRPEGSGKYFLPVLETRGIDPQPDCRAQWLVFPEISEALEPVLEPLDARQALARLSHQSLLPGRESAAREHFDALVGLCETVSTHRLVVGPDLGAVVARLDALVGR